MVTSLKQKKWLRVIVEDGESSSRLLDNHILTR